MTDALQYVLVGKGLTSTDELRRSMEDLPPEDYEGFSYYERWAAGIEALLVEKNVLTTEEIYGMARELADRCEEE